VTTLLAIVAAVLGVSLLIVIHEAGHFLAARRFGMRVERFSVGFGPVVGAFRRGDTEFALSALPLGGYVRITGMAPGDEFAPGDPRAYANQAAWRRFLVILAGPAMNYVAAVVIAAALLATVGLRAPDPAPRVGTLVPGMPAAQAGLRPGDRIVAAGGKPVESFAELVGELRSHPGQQIPLDVVRDDGSQVTISITPKNEGGVGRVGFQQATLTVRRGPLAAVAEGFKLTNVAAAAQLAAFGSLFSGGSKAELSGPVGIAQELVRGARQGAEPFLTLVWTISIVLAILNLLLVPALDGGRLVFLLFEIVTGRRANARVESFVHFAGMIALLVLILAVTVFRDFARLLGR
jgi:regulator of sigma E protease